MNRKVRVGSISDFELLHIASTSNAILVRTLTSDRDIWLPFDRVCIHRTKRLAGYNHPVIVISMPDSIADMKGLTDQKKEFAA